MRTSHRPLGLSPLDFWEGRFAQVAWIVMPLIMMLFGTVGNVLSIVVLLRREVGYMTATPYLIALAVVDILVLYTGLLRHWVRKAFSIDIRDTSNIICKMNSFFVYYSFQVSVWIIVLLTIERFICVCFPFKARSIRFTHRLSAMGGVFVFFFLLNIHYFFGKELRGFPVKKSKVYRCADVSGQYRHFRLYSWSWIDFSMFCFVPFAVIVTCNVCILAKLYASFNATRRRIAPTGDREASTANIASTRVVIINTVSPNGMGETTRGRVDFVNNESSVSHRRKSSNTTALLLTLNTVFLITTAPIAILLIYLPYWKRPYPHEGAKFNLAYMIANILSYTNNSSNFLLYCVTGPRFRAGCRALFKCKSKDSQNEDPSRRPAFTGVDVHT